MRAPAATAGNVASASTWVIPVRARYTSNVSSMANSAAIRCTRGRNGSSDRCPRRSARVTPQSSRFTGCRRGMTSVRMPAGLWPGAARRGDAPASRNRLPTAPRVVPPSSGAGLTHRALIVGIGHAQGHQDRGHHLRPTTIGGPLVQAPQRPQRLQAQWLGPQHRQVLRYRFERPPALLQHRRQFGPRFEIRRRMLHDGAEFIGGALR